MRAQGLPHGAVIKVAVIVQARMGSTRLPGKVLKTVLGKPLLEYQLERLARVKNADAVAVATSTLPADDAIEALVKKPGFVCFRGSEADVLGRYYVCAKHLKAQAVVRSTADCPLIDPELTEGLIAEFLERGDCDYGSNATIDRTYPRGLDLEIFSFKALEAAAREAKDPAEREHVTAFIVRRPERFRCFSLRNKEDLGDLRWTVDTPEDFELISKIIEGLYPRNPTFSWTDALALINKNPQWSRINSHIEQKTR